MIFNNMDLEFMIFCDFCDRQKKKKKILYFSKKNIKINP